MSTNTVTADTTRTNQKSQLVDDPYFHSLHLHHELTQLLDTTVYCNKWFSRVSKVLNIRKKELTTHVSLHHHWRKGWGEISIGVSVLDVIWERLDGGPELYDSSEIDAKIKIIRFMLMANLIEAFKDLDRSSYEKVGITKNWNRAKVKLNMTEIENVLWADALTGRVAVKAYETAEKVLTGHVDIILQDKNLSFF